jgi:alpha-1,2-mannosyltransferase
MMKTMSSRRKIALFMLLGFLFFMSLFLIKVKDDMEDFEVNYKAGQRLLWGETLYRFEDEHFMFKYFPCSALIYVPLSYLPLAAAKSIWYSLVVFCSVSLFCFSRKLAASSQKKDGFLIALPPLILARYFFREIELGQINALVTMILVLMVWLMSSGTEKASRNKDIISGWLWGMATALKPYAVIFFPYFIIKRKWKAVLSGFVFVVLALLVPSLYYGFEGNLRVLKEWYSTLSQSTPRLLSTWDNISLIGFFTKWTGNQALSIVLAGFVIGILGLLVLILVLKGNNVPRAEVLDSSILLICIPLISPLGWDYNLLMSVLGVTILVYNIRDFSGFWRIVLLVNFFIIAFSIYDIMGRELYGRFMTWSIPTLSFLLIIGYLASLRIKKTC